MVEERHGRMVGSENHPATRAELHYGARIIRCFVERPKSVDEMLANAVARRPQGLALICGEERLSYSEFDALVGEAAGGLRALGVGNGDRVAMVSATASNLSSCCSHWRGWAQCRFRSTSATRWPRTATSSRIPRQRWSCTNWTSPIAFPQPASSQV